MRRLFWIAIGIALIVPALSEANVPHAPLLACTAICWSPENGSSGCVYNNQMITCNLYWTWAVEA